MMVEKGSRCKSGTVTFTVMQTKKRIFLMYQGIYLLYTKVTIGALCTEKVFLRMKLSQETCRNRKVNFWDEEMA